jgi:hypothetical protein
MLGTLVGLVGAAVFLASGLLTWSLLRMTHRSDEDAAAMMARWARQSGAGASDAQTVPSGEERARELVLL